MAGFAALYAHQSSVLQLKHDNDPLRFIKLNTFKSHQIKFADQVRSCEDVLLLEERGLALMACDPGRERWNTVMVSHAMIFSSLFFPAHSFASSVQFFASSFG